MAARIQPKYYRDGRGREPVNDFIDGLPPKHQRALDNQIDRVRELCDSQNRDLPFPHSSQVDGPLRELRCHYGNTLYRILYRHSGNFVVLLHAIFKNTKKIPPEDIAIANARWEDFKKRMDAKPRVPPRAAGADAPGSRRKS